MSISASPSAGPNQIGDIAIENVKERIRRGEELSPAQLDEKFRGEAKAAEKQLQQDGIDTSKMHDVQKLALQFERNLQFIPPYISIKELSDKGAAGMCNLASNRVWLDEGVLSLGMTRKTDEQGKPYWARVVDHELIHRDKQAAQFDKNYVQWDDNIIPLVALLEGEATEANAWEDLTLDYKQYRTQYVQLEKYVGRKALDQATHDGKVSLLQEAIDMKAAQDNTGISLKAVS